MDFLKPAKYFFFLSTAATFISIGLLISPSPRLSIEFTGGTRMELETVSAKSQEEVTNALNAFKEQELFPIVNKRQDGVFVVRIKGISDDMRKILMTLKIRAIYALLAASIGIILYLAFAFRSIPRRYSPWKFGVVAVATLLHDVMVTVGIMSLVSHATSFEADTLFITALLTILGYSVNDTIIIFDRIRDNLLSQEKREDFAVICNRSVGESWKRSCFTSGSTLIMLCSLFALGPASIQWFVLTLIIGILLGTYSSIFVATPLLVYWNNRK
jgi:preprotein translocase subunit SecF